MQLDAQNKMNLHDLAMRSSQDIMSIWDKSFELVSTRMSFSHEMLELQQTQDVSVFHKSGPGVDLNLQSTISVKRTEFYFEKRELPITYQLYQKRRLDDGLSLTQPSPSPDVEPVGLVRYEGMFHDYELSAIEKACDQVQHDSENNVFKPMTSHHTIFQGECRRTKHFFRARYLWTKAQIEEPDAERAGGLRSDVSAIPDWMQFVISRMELVGVVPQNFINGVALNMYHDGTIGIGLHSDCYSRFDRPIVTLRCFSSARLTIGGHHLGENAVAVVDLPRGAVLSMLKDSYAADGIKHCVRNCDMVTKSAALIFRHLHNECVDEADRMREE